MLRRNTGYERFCSKKCYDKFYYKKNQKRKLLHYKHKYWDIPKLREKIKRYHKKYYEENREKIRKKQNSDYNKNLEIKRYYCRKSYWKNRDKILSRARSEKYRKEHYRKGGKFYKSKIILRKKYDLKLKRNKATLSDVIINTLGRRCIKCGKTKNLIVNHLSYKNPTINDVDVRCKNCNHKRF
jgi:hypothetical protein